MSWSKPIALLPIILMVALSLLLGILTGWFRLGFDMPVSKVFLHHGAIMTGSFLGTVILMERVVALKKKWLFMWPLINVSSVLFYFIGYPMISFACLIVGAIGLFWVFYLINNIHSDLPHQLMWVASAAWLVGNVFLFLYESYAQSILWWMAFLLITIVGERLELNRFLPVSNTKRYFLVGLLGVFLIACVVPFHMGGRYLAGASFMLSAAWLIRYDMVRKSIKRPGLHRYSAVTLLLGYVWLGFSGILFLFEGTGEVPYDALMHAFFLGFVFSMIFAHAPIILPGVAGISVRPYHPLLYIWVVLLHASLVVRVFGGFMQVIEMKKWGGLLNGVVIVLFLINLVILTVDSKRANGSS